MNYNAASIHTKINAKGNALILYRSYKDGVLIRRVARRDTDLFDGERMMTRPDQVHYPVNDESVPSDWWSGGIAENH